MLTRFSTTIFRSTVCKCGSVKKNLKRGLSVQGVAPTSITIAGVIEHEPKSFTIRHFATVPEEEIATELRYESKQTDESSLPVTFSDISRAQVAIRSGIVRTACEKSHFLSDIIGANIFLKAEMRQVG